MLDFLFQPPAVLGIEVRILLALAFTGAAAYYDLFNKKWVPNFLIYGFVAAAIAVNIVFFTPDLFIQALAFGAIMSALTYPLYRLGQLGGADVYVMASIAAAIPYLAKPVLAPAQAVPYPFILSVLAPTGLLFILHMLARFVPHISKKIAQKKLALPLSRLVWPALLAAAFLLFVSTIASLPVYLPYTYLLMLSFLFTSLLFFSLFKEEIKESMMEFLPIRKLQEEDVLALEKMDKGLVARLKLSPLLTKESIALLKKSKLKSAPVYTGMPYFLPYLFLGLLFTVLFGDLLIYVIGA